MAYGVKLEVWGDYAAFNRPEMKVERMSYEVMTPSAARGVLEAIYWKPEMKWVVREIRVLRPICFTHVRRNEISPKIPVKGSTGVASAMKSGRGTLGVAVESVRQQRAAMVLRNVRYGIAAEVVVQRSEIVNGRPIEHPEAKHLDMFKRRAQSGQFFHHPYMGVREFPGFFEWVDDFSRCPDELLGDRDLGLMLHDIEFAPDPKGDIIESNQGTRLSATTHFFHARMHDGVIHVPKLVEKGRGQ